MKRNLAQIRTASLRKNVSGYTFAGIFLCLLIGASSVQAAGVNVNSLVQLDPIPATFRTLSDTAGCPSGFAGKFSLTAILKNKPASPAMPGIAIHVHTLTNGNLLLNPETNEVLGGEGAVMEVAPAGNYADGLLSSGETVDVPFLLCLRTRAPFQFFVDVFGVVTQLVSVNPEGESGGGSFPVISTDGRFVAFQSRGRLLSDSQLPGGGANGLSQVYLRDLQSGVNTLVSINRYGTGGGNADSFYAALSPNNRYVAFYVNGPDGFASDLSTDGSACPAIVGLGQFPAGCLYVRDLVAGTTVPLAFPTDWRDVVFSADSQLMAFTAGNTHANGSDLGEIFVHDLTTGSTALVSASLSGTGHTGFFIQSFHPIISADGRYVAFTSTASDLVTNDTTQRLDADDVFVRDLKAGTTTLVSVEKTGTTSGDAGSTVVGISADGRYVIFSSGASDLVANDTNGTGDLFIRDLLNATTTLVTVNRFGTNSGHGGSEGGRASSDARFVVFTSAADDLVANDANGQPDVFWADLQTGTIQLVSVNRTGTGSADRGASGPLDISDDGRYVLFFSASNDLTASNNTSGTGIFVRDMVNGVTSLVNVNQEGTDSVPTDSAQVIGHEISFDVISADGHVVVFHNSSDGLVPNDKNGTFDVFVRPVP